MTRIFIFVLSGVVLVGCMSSVSLKTADGSTVTGHLSNGAISYSAGSACEPTAPNPTTPLPVQPVAAPVMVPKRVCDGTNCLMVMAPSAPDPATPTCYTQVVNVRGTDPTTLFGWIIALAGAALVSASSGAY